MNNIPELGDLLDEVKYHEITDRLLITCENISNHLIQHPVCKLDKDVSVNIEKALELLFKAYQIAGTK